MDRLEGLELAHALTSRTRNMIDGINRKIAEAHGYTHIEVRTQALVEIAAILETHNMVLQKSIEHEFQIHEQLEDLVEKHTPKK